MATKAVDKEIVYKWTGKDKRNKAVKGELRGATAGLIKAELRRQGITPLKVSKKPKALFESKGTIVPKDIMLFTRQMCTMLASGIPIVQAMEMVGHGTKKPVLKHMILDIKSSVEGGTSFANSLKKHPLHFGDLYCSLVAAGEEAGVLETMLNKVGAYLEKSESTKKKIKSAIMYPAIVVVAAIIVTSIIMIFVIPVFEDLFKNFGSDLPAFTQFVVEISHYFQNYWWLGLAIVGGSIWGFIFVHKRSRKFRQTFDRITLKLPLFGVILDLSANARFARTLSTMFAGGVPLVDAMTSVAGATGNAVYEEAVLDMRDSVSTGQQLNFAMRQTSLFPDMVIQMVAIGEEAGSLSDMLAKVADFYEEELDTMIDMLTTLIEPLLMAFLGVVVGGLVVAMYLPIFKLGAVV